MAVKKAKSVEPEVTVTTGEERAEEESKKEIKKVRKTVEKSESVEETKEETVEVEPEVSAEPVISVDTTTVKESNIPEEKNVKIRMRVNHSCTIAMQRYDLKAGQCYNVPVNVRDILNRAGLLAPL